MTASARSASAIRAGPAKLATARLTPSWIWKVGQCTITLKESTEPCLVEGGPYGGVYDGLVCAGNGNCRYV